MNSLVYGVKDRPSFPKVLLFSLQQLLAILAATILVPAIIGNEMSQAAALFGAGVGTIVYLAITKFRSPVFLGSSFAFLNSMAAAFAGAVTVGAGYLGLIIGALLAGLVYVILAILVKFLGTGWINKIMPPVIIGPTVAIIGLSLSGNAISDLFKGGVASTNMYLAMGIGLITLFVTIAASIFGNKMIKLIPFIIGILAGYAIAALFTAMGQGAHNDALKVVNFDKFKEMSWVPDFSFIKAFSSFKDFENVGSFMQYFGAIALAYVPVAFVVFAEHIADHKNLSSIIGTDLLENPGLHRTLLGDGVGSMVGAFFGGCPNTTYGESIGCVAITKNASVVTILATAIMAIVLSFIAPVITFLATIPNCVMGGICIALYGFIAVSGLKMLQGVDLGDNRNLFTASVILIAGVGGFALNFGKVYITNIACALILGILVHFFIFLIDYIKKTNKPEKEVSYEAEQPKEEEKTSNSDEFDV